MTLPIPLLEPEQTLMFREAAQAAAVIATQF